MTATAGKYLTASQVAETRHAHPKASRLSPQAIIQSLRQQPARLENVSALLMHVPQSKGQCRFGNLPKHFPEKALVLHLRDAHLRLCHKVTERWRSSECMLTSLQNGIDLVADNL